MKCRCSSSRPSRSTDFKIANNTVTPNSDYRRAHHRARLGHHRREYGTPTTIKLKVGTKTYEPFGGYSSPVDANVNDDAAVTGNKLAGKNPRSYIVPEIFAKGSSINVIAHSFLKKSSGASGKANADWDEYLVADSSKSNCKLVYALRDGDKVPNTPGFSGQASISTYVKNYVDTKTNTMKLASNEVIWLFELGTDDLKSTAADFQDVVVLISLAGDTSYFTQTGTTVSTNPTITPKGFKVTKEWTDKDGNIIAPELASTTGTTMDACGNPIQDKAGTAGAAGTGGITNAASFDDWFRDKMGTNLSMNYSITLTQDSSGVWSYDTDHFYPGDNALLGNEDEDHNYFFTFQFNIEFTYNKCTKQFFEFAGSDDAWVFVDGRMAIDLGGVVPGAKQRADMDRMGLVDGQTYTLSFFYAQRQKQYGDFHVRTNIIMVPDANLPTVSAGYD